MKSYLLFLPLLFCGMQSRAQLSSDSLHPNEITVSMLPVINSLSSAGGGGPNYNLYIAFKRHIAKGVILRAGLSYYPNTMQRWNDGMIQLDRTVDTVNIFRMSNSNAHKVQIKLGVEKIIRSKRMSHALGADLLLHTQWSSFHENYWWESNRFAIDPQKMYEHMNSDQHRVDSLSSYVSSRGMGAGIHFFYSPRVQLSKRFYLTATFGPSMTITSTRNTGGKSKHGIYKGRFMSMDFDLLLSDLSLAYRF